MPPQVESWLLQFVRFELQTLLQNKQAASKQTTSKPWPRRPQNVPAMDKRYELRDSGGFKVCCRDSNSDSPPVHVFQILDAGRIVSAQIADSMCFLNTKFSHAARASFQKRHSNDLVKMKQGTLIKMFDFELHLTLHGDEAWYVSLLVNEFRVAEAISCAPPLKYAPLVDIGDVREMLVSLMGRPGDSDALEPSLVEVEDNNSNNSDIASQDGPSQEFEHSLASQATFATQAKSVPQSKKKASHPVNTLSGVNMSAPQPPRRNSHSAARTHNAGSAQINSNAHQLLLLLSRKEKIAAGESSNKKDDDSSNLAAATPNLQLPTPNTMPKSIRKNESAPTSRSVISAPPSRPMQLDYFSMHRDDFHFVTYTKNSDSTDDKQHELLRHAASWHNPEPGVQFPGLNVPVDVLGKIKSLSESKPVETTEPLDGVTPMVIETNVDSAIATSDHEGNISGEFNPAASLEVESHESSLSQGSQSSSPEEFIEWSSSPPQPVNKNPENFDEPLDSSIESLKRGASKTRKRSQSPTSPLTDHARKRPKTQSPALAGHDYENPALIARRKKLDFVTGRRARQQHPGAHHDTLHGTLSGKAREFGTESRMPTNASKKNSSPAVIQSNKNPTDKSVSSEDKCCDELEARTTNIDDEHDQSMMGNTSINSSLASLSVLENSDTQPQEFPSCRVAETQDGVKSKSSCLVLKEDRPDSQRSNTVSEQEDQNKADQRGHDYPHPPIIKETPVRNHACVHRDRGPIYLGSFDVSKKKSPSHLAKSLSSDENSSQLPNSTQPQRWLNKAAVSADIRLRTGRYFIGPAAESDPTKVPWWKTDDTVFKSFARGYANLKVLDGALGQLGKDGVPTQPAKSLDLLAWPL